MTISYIDSGWHIFMVRHGGKSFSTVMMLGLSGCPQHSLHQDGQGFLIDKDRFSRPQGHVLPLD